MTETERLIDTENTADEIIQINATYKKKNNRITYNGTQYRYHGWYTAFWVVFSIFVIIPVICGAIAGIYIGIIMRDTGKLIGAAMTAGASAVATSFN